MRYERDESGLRDAQENLRDAQDDEAKAKIQDQIDLIEKEIDALNKQKEALEEHLESVTKYYEKLIKEQEKYFDEMIEALENTKSKWEELAEVDAISKAWSLVASEMEDTGYTVEDVLNDVPGAFETFKDKYINFLSEMHNKDQGYLDGLKEYSDGYNKVVEKATEAQKPIADLSNSASTASGNVSKLGTSASTAASGVSDLKEASEGISDDLNGLNENVNLDPLVNEKLSAFENALTNLKNLINGTGPEGSIKSAFEDLNNLNLQGVVDAFGALADAIGAVATALGVGGGDQEATYGAPGKSGKNGMPTSVPTSAVNTGGGAGLAGAIQEVREAAVDSIGTNPEAEGEDAVGAFVALKNAVDNVNKLIGMGEEGGAPAEAEQGEETLTACITSLLPTTEESLGGDTGVIAMFNQLNEAINACLEAARELLSIIEQLENVELPNIHGGNHGHFFTGTAISGQHYEGTAKLSGDWGIRGNERALVGELGQEMLIRDGHFRTIGDNGPEFVQLKKGDVILNHKQTAELLSKKNLVTPKRGPAHADGTFGGFTFSDSYASLMNSIRQVGMPTMNGIKEAIQAHSEAMKSEIKNIATTKTNVTQNNTFNVSGVTGEEVARTISNTLTQTFSGMSLNAYQRSMA